MGNMLKEIERVDKNIIKKIKMLQTASVHEALGQSGAMCSEIKPLERKMRLCGTAITVRCFIGDNLTIHRALSIAKEGDVLVVDAGEYKEIGAWGEIASVAAFSRGVQGLVIDGAVRDTERICELKFPTFCRGVSIRGTVKKTLGDMNSIIVCGGVIVHPGDIILGDGDGVVVIPKKDVQETYQKAMEREKRERKMMEELRRGKLTVDLLGLRPVIEEQQKIL